MGADKKGTERSKQSADPLAERGVWKVPPGTFQQHESAAEQAPAPDTTEPVEAPEAGEFTRLFQPSAEAPDEPQSPESMPTVAFEKPDTGKPETKQQPPAAEAGEFTRLFEAGPPGGEPAADSAPTVSMQIPAPATPAAPNQPSEEAPGEFTRLFRPSAEAPDEPQSPESMPTVAFEKPGTRKPETKQQPPAAEADEFTRLFEAGSPAPTQNEIPSPPAAKPPASELGEFTRLFKSSDSLEERAATPDKPAPGAFTRLFQSGGQPEAGSPPPSSGPKSNDAGEFTRFFQSPLGEGTDRGQDLGAAPPPEPKKPEPEMGEYTRLFQAPPPTTRDAPTDRSASGVYSVPEAPGEPVIEPRLEEGPSEFTRIIEAGSLEGTLSEAKTAGPAPGEPESAPSKGLPVWLWILFATVFVLTVVVILYFVLRH